ncbi:MAG: very short patch repair endonuclease [Bryobacteraceae bacterium]
MASLARSPSLARSRNMRAIRSYGNRSTEVRLRAGLVRQGVRGWRVQSGAFGAPDFLFCRERIAIFADGCFWHGCPRCGHIPKTNAQYWRQKIAKNRQRDLLVSRTLKRTGYTVIRMWECQVRSDLAGCVRRIRMIVEAR